MSSYLKPLRRKMGVLTLVIACAFAGVWVRSSRVSDRLTFYLGNQLYDLTSVEEGVIFSKSCEAPPEAGRFIRWRSSWIAWRCVINEPPGGLPSSSFLDESVFFFPMTYRLAWHWTIVLPLTLVSGILLLPLPWRMRWRPFVKHNDANHE